jgi:hypothetical protein
VVSYVREQPIMTTTDMALALEQHMAQNPLATAQSKTESIYAALDTASRTQDAEEYSTSMAIVWEGVGDLCQMITRSQQGVQNGHHLSKALAEQLTTMVRHLVDPSVPESERSEAVNVFAARIEEETYEMAQEFALKSLAGTMQALYGVEEDVAEAFIGVLTGVVGELATAALDAILPQLAELRTTIDGVRV